ncbi:transporter [Lutibacter holmesii]|uniref:Transporter n=1 Tax=Lutibacter holmesii TaxID=1137985 RepID=A0ABW3WKG3_9FLAO
MPLKNKYILILLFFSISSGLFAQGDGPRAHLFAPKGVWALNVKYLHLDQNLLPGDNILVKNADIKIQLFPTTFVHTFGIGKKFARVFFMLNPGSLNANIATPIKEINEGLTASGFSDGYVALEYGLIGAPALNALEFSKHQPQFSLNALFKYWYSGTYNSEKLLNLGTNRSAFEFGATMAIPFHKNISENATWLEIIPSVQFYTKNNDPARSNSANVVEQDPLLIIENHLTHNFTKKLWAGIDLRYQYGGTTKADGISDDNLNNILGGGVNLGYQISAPLSIFAGYDKILAGDNNAKSNMLRVSVVFAYINLKKLKQTL